MKSRTLSAFVGLLVMVLSVVWPRVIQHSEGSMLGAFGGYFSFIGIMLGVYLLFYSMTGDWLPKLAKRDRRN
jgi:vacuolar-type H+-ATPase subunit I/STV1